VVAARISFWFSLPMLKILDENTNSENYKQFWPKSIKHAIHALGIKP
jgi:hypothetical protein